MKQLAKDHGQVLITSPNGMVWDLSESDSSGWKEITGVGVPANSFFVSESYIDLAGLSMEEKTVFFEAMTVQTGGPPLLTGAGAESNFRIFDFMTSIPVDLVDFTTTLQWVQGIGFGTPRQQLNFENVHYARTQYFATDLDFNFTVPRQTSTHQHGSLGSTASDRLYVYRIVYGTMVLASGATTISLLIPPARHLVLASVKEEPDYVYMMRLKRSYDLQNEPDRD
jgi:hypothetical protein